METNTQLLEAARLFTERLSATHGVNGVSRTWSGSPLTIGPGAERRLNRANIMKALQEFNIKAPLTIKPTGGRYRYGTHRASLRLGNLSHSITFNTHLEPRRLSETLWHELCHARQVEVLGFTEFKKRYAQEQRRKGYQDNGFEVEARQCEENHIWLPLT